MKVTPNRAEQAYIHFEFSNTRIQKGGVYNQGGSAGNINSCISDEC